MSLRRIRQAAVERAAESGARAALEQIGGAAGPSRPAPALNVAQEMVSLPDEGVGVAVVRAVGTRTLQSALGNGATAAGATTAAPTRNTLADIEIRILPLPGGLSDLQGNDPLAEAEALLGEDAPPAPETSPPSATTEPPPPPSDTLSEAAPDVEAALEVAIEAAAGEERAAETEAIGETLATGEEAAAGTLEGETIGEAAPIEGEVTVGGAPAGVPILMPEPPAELTPAAQERVVAAQRAAGGAARSQANMPPAGENVSAAQGAVTPPQEEQAGRAQASVVKLLGEQPGPSPDIQELCRRIKAVIREKRPPDDDSLVKANPRAMAAEAGGEMNRNVQGDANRVAGAYDNSLGETPAGSSAPPGRPAEPIPAAAPGDVNAAGAVPDPVPAENVSLGADVAASQQRMDEAGMNSPAAQEVNSGPIAEAREAQSELEATAERDPAEVLAEQAGALASAGGDMAALQEQALAALESARAATIGGIEGQRGEMVGTEEQMRAEAGRKAQAIFTTAQAAVNAQLSPLPAKAMEMWQTGVAIESTRFEQSLARVERWINKRHAGVGGALLGLVDAVVGLPDWVNEQYDLAEKKFGDGVCELILQISTQVNTVIAACQAIIAQADRDITAVYDSLPAELQGWAAGERERFQGQLNGLNQQATEARDNFNRDLAERASQAVQDVRGRIHELRQAAGGLLGRITDAITAFLDDPARAIINGLLSILGIAPGAFWALVARIEQAIDDIANDPMGFANNLVSALKAGFQRFFDNFGTHFLDGLLGWLFSGLGSVGVTVPSDFSLESVITFFLQLMGLSWANIRRILARHIGEENVALIEQAWDYISMLIEMGPAGIYEMIKEQLNPKNMLDTVLQMAVDFVIETLIRQVIVRVIGMLNPAGAIAQAIEVIYKVGKWIFENAARIFTLIETVVSGIADLIAGNIGGMANAIEGALAGLMIPVIDFLAELLGLGGLPEKVADTIGRFQEMVLGHVDRAIGFVVKKVKGLLAKLGGKDDDKPDERTEEEKQADVNSAVSEGTALNEDLELEVDAIRERLKPIKKKYRLTVLELVEDEETGTVKTVHVYGEINPKQDGKEVEHYTKMPLVILKFTFDRKFGYDPVEYQRQLREQEGVINGMLINNWVENQKSFLSKLPDYKNIKAQRRKRSDKAKREYRAAFRRKLLWRIAKRRFGKTKEYKEIAKDFVNNFDDVDVDMIVPLVGDTDIIKQVNTYMRRRAATHRLDSVASGNPVDISGLADSRINSHIGAKWKSQIQIILAVVNAIPKGEWTKLKMNVKMFAVPE